MSLKVGGNGQLSDILRKSQGKGGFHPQSPTKAQKRAQRQAASRVYAADYPRLRIPA